MSFVSMVVVFAMTWWVVLLAVLPWGVRTQEEEGEVTLGTAPSAPAKPMLVRKAIVTTAITCVIFAAFWSVVEFELFSLRDWALGRASR